MGNRDMERLFVWAGGAAFVASLATTGWTYAARFGAARSPQGWGAVAIDTALLTVFALHHSVFARESAKRALLRLVPSRMLRSVYVWIASLLLIAVCVCWQPVGGSLYQAEGWPMWLFALIQLAGVALIARSVRAIDALELAGIHSTAPRPAALQTGGVYGLVRHPLYFGWLLVVFGSPHMTGDRLTFAVLTTLYLIVAVPWEERTLVDEFGPAYEDYRARVRWRMLPFVY